MAKRNGLEELAEPAVGERLQLALHREVGNVAVEETIARRRSVREFAPTPVGLSQILQLLWSAQGLTSADGRRAAPSVDPRQSCRL